jgi:hypothetical protein
LGQAPGAPGAPSHLTHPSHPSHPTHLLVLFDDQIVQALDCAIRIRRVDDEADAAL